MDFQYPHTETQFEKDYHKHQYERRRKEFMKRKEDRIAGIAASVAWIVFCFVLLAMWS